MSTALGASEPIDGHALLQANQALRTCLDAVPHFTFSETGRQNLCRRFHLSDAELSAVLVAYTPPVPDSSPVPCSHSPNSPSKTSSSTTNA